MEPSDSPQVRISSAGANEAQIILGLSILVDFLSFMKDVLASFTAGVRNSLSFANSMVIKFITLHRIILINRIIRSASLAPRVS